MEHFLNLEIGNLTNLRGSCAVYWNNKDNEGENQILTVNFCISAFPLDENLVVTTFPLVVFSTREEFMFYITQSGCDLICLGESSHDSSSGEYTLTDEEYKALNVVIENYLYYYRYKITQKFENLSPISQIHVLQKWIDKLEDNFKKEEFSTSINIVQNIETLMNFSWTTQIPAQDKKNFLKFIKDIKVDYFELIRLYLKEFLAILSEEYEQVVFVKNKIKSFLNH